MAEQNSDGDDRRSNSSSKSGESRSSGSSGGGRSSDSGSSGGQGRSSSRKKVDPADLARTAVRTVARFTGRRPESVLGVTRDGDGWRVIVEVVEMSRIPTSTDLLGAYVVSLDDRGDVVGYERRQRYQRGQVGGDEG